MVMEIVHAAIARKMLCQPVNQLIAPTELVCSVGVMARRIGISLEEAKRIAEFSDIMLIQQEMERILFRQNLTEFEESYQNLAKMIQAYQSKADSFCEEYRELFLYAYKNPLKFPKMNL